MENSFKIETIHSKQDFLSLKKSGSKIYTKQGLIFCFVQSQKPQFSWTISRFVGNAVLRNKLKRYCRESVRDNYKQFEVLNLRINIVFPSKKSKIFQSIRFIEVDEAIKEFLYKYNKQFL